MSVVSVSTGNAHALQKRRSQSRCTPRDASSIDIASGRFAVGWRPRAPRMSERESAAVHADARARESIALRTSREIRFQSSRDRLRQIEAASESFIALHVSIDHLSRDPARVLPRELPASVRIASTGSSRTGLNLRENLPASRVRNLDRKRNCFGTISRSMRVRRASKADAAADGHTLERAPSMP
jgi:hypothetical protein